MRADDCLRFLVGQREAIQRVASSSATIWTGFLLVLLTAIARSYDQTLITENPLMWIFGPLLKGGGALLFVWNYFTHGSPESFLLFAIADGALASWTLVALLKKDPSVL